MIAGPNLTAGQTFELDQFNSKNPTVNPVTQSAIAPLGFHTTTQGFSSTAGQALPFLALPRVFVLTTGSTCSASESIINSLQGVNVQVVQIGSTTCGKPYGFYPTDNCAVTYFSIQFQSVNAMGFGNYPDGCLGARLFGGGRLCALPRGPGRRPARVGAQLPGERCLPPAAERRAASPAAPSGSLCTAGGGERRRDQVVLAAKPDLPPAGGAVRRRRNAGVGAYQPVIRALLAAMHCRLA